MLNEQDQSKIFYISVKFNHRKKWTFFIRVFFKTKSKDGIVPCQSEFWDNMFFSLYAKYLEAPVQLGFLNHQVQDVPVITALSTANRRQVCGTGQRTDWRVLLQHVTQETTPSTLGQLRKRTVTQILSRYLEEWNKRKG